MDEIGDLIDLERYPLDRTDGEAWVMLVERCRTAHREDGCANLPGFVRADALAAFAREASALLERHGYRKSTCGRRCSTRAIRRNPPTTRPTASSASDRSSSPTTRSATP